MDLNKHIVTNDTSKPFHSSGFAKVANSDHFGATSNVSFDQRQQIERNRQLVTGYQRSTIGESYGVLRAKPVSKQAIVRKGTPIRPTIQQRNSIAVAPRQFRESSSRRYDPYA